MIIPTIHLNGTSKESLIEDLCAASNALRAAYDALKQTAPNGRDYYPQGPKALEDATAEHFSRLSRVDSVRQEIESLAIAIDEELGNK